MPPVLILTVLTLAKRGRTCHVSLGGEKLRALDPDLAPTYLLGKVVGTRLIDALRNPERSFSPDGCPLKTDTP